MLVEDRLFATLDPTTRRLALPGGEPVLLTDTVGFVRRLPHGLVEAFKSTLEVVAEADLLVHVVDASAADPDGQIDAVRAVLAEIGADRVPELLVFNKADLAPSEAKRLVDDAPGLGGDLSAVTGEGIDDLLRTLGDRLRALTDVVELFVPYDRGDVLAAVHREGEVVSTSTSRRRRDAGRAGAGSSDGRPPAALPELRRRAASASDWPLTDAGFVPPPYPYDRLDALAAARRAPRRRAASTCRSARRATRRRRRCVDALVDVGHRARLPAEHRHARRCARPAAGWIARRFGVDVARRPVAACVGTKEFVGTLPQWLRLRTPDRDTVLYPAVAYPTYEMGAILAGCRPVPVPVDADGRLDLAAIDPADAARALCLWVNSAGQPDRRARRPRRGGGVGPGATACRCSATSATSSSPGTGRRARSSSTGSTAWSPSTRCRSARTSPALRVGFYAGDAELVALPAARCASTSG